MLDHERVLDHRHRDADRVGLLEAVGAEQLGAHLAGDEHDRHGVHHRVADRRDQVRRARGRWSRTRRRPCRSPSRSPRRRARRRPRGGRGCGGCRRRRTRRRSAGWRRRAGRRRHPRPPPSDIPSRHRLPACHRPPFLDQGKKPVYQRVYSAALRRRPMRDADRQHDQRRRRSPRAARSASRPRGSVCAPRRSRTARPRPRSPPRAAPCGRWRSGTAACGRCPPSVVIAAGDRAAHDAPSRGRSARRCPTAPPTSPC